jgi:hypothetical protein
MSSFKEEDIGLSSELDSSEKQAELDKSFKKEERKKFERKFKKDMNDWDSLYNGNPALSQSA